MSWQRDERLEAVLRSSRADDTPWLVYGDWLAEHGDDFRAAVFHALGGRLDANSPTTRRAIAMAVASSAWSNSQPHDYEVPRVSEALPSFVKTGNADWPRFGSESPMHLAIEALRKNDLPAAARAARSPGDAPVWFGHFASLLETADAFESAVDFVSELEVLTTETKPAAAQPKRFSFEHVMITNATQGIQGAVIWGNTALASDFLALAHHIEGVPLDDEHFIDQLTVDASGWENRSPFQCVDELFGMREANEGHEVADAHGTETPLLEMLEQLGPCLGGARSDSDFPWSFMRFTKGTLAFHLVY